VGRHLMWLCRVSSDIDVYSAPRAHLLALCGLMGAFSWMIAPALARHDAELRDREFVAAARYMGVSNRRILVSQHLPKVASIIIIDTALNVGVAVLAETGLSGGVWGCRHPAAGCVARDLIAYGHQVATTFP